MGRHKKKYNVKETKEDTEVISDEDIIDFDAMLENVMVRNHMASNFKPFMKHLLMSEKDEPRVCAGLVSKGGFAEDTLVSAVVEAIQQNPNSRLMFLSPDSRSYMVFCKLVWKKLSSLGLYVYDRQNNMIYNGTSPTNPDYPPEEEEDDDDSDSEDEDKDSEDDEEYTPDFKSVNENRWYCIKCDTFEQIDYIREQNIENINTNRKNKTTDGFSPSCASCSAKLSMIPDTHRLNGYIIFKRLNPAVLNNTLKPSKIFMYNPCIVKREYFNHIVDNTTCKIHVISTLNYRYRNDWTPILFEGKPYKNTVKFSVTINDILGDTNVENSLKEEAKKAYNHTRVPRVRDTEYMCNFNYLKRNIPHSE